MQISKGRPISFIGFQVWLKKEGVIAHLKDYEANTKGNYTEYSTIIKDIKNAIWEDQFSGAAVGIYKENIIARNLGLTEKTEHETKLITSESANKFLDMVVQLADEALSRKEAEKLAKELDEQNTINIEKL